MVVVFKPRDLNFRFRERSSVAEEEEEVSELEGKMDL